MSETGERRLDIQERGARGQTSNRRLFMQLVAYGNCRDRKPLLHALEASEIECVLYQDVNDPRGVAVLAMHEDPAFFAVGLREVLGGDSFASLSHRAEVTMLGRTYSSGFEPDLEDWLLHRPRRVVLDAACPWAIWYPLRRSGAFARLSGQEQGAILREHGELGRKYGEAGFAHDIRLACHGLDVHDNDFVIGLVGPDLHPLSHLVQAMRKTRQTSEYIVQMGPFFVGYVTHRVRVGK